MDVLVSLFFYDEYLVGKFLQVNDWIPDVVDVEDGVHFRSG